VVLVPPTTTVPAIDVCKSQWKLYVPGVLNVHVPLQLGAVGV